MKIIKFNNCRYAEPPIGRPISPPGFVPKSCHPHRDCPNSNRRPVDFETYRIPQFTLDLDLRPRGNRMPREEANITGRIKYILQLNGFRGVRG